MAVRPSSRPRVDGSPNRATTSAWVLVPGVIPCQDRAEARQGRIRVAAAKRVGRWRERMPHYTFPAHAPPAPLRVVPPDRRPRLRLAAGLRARIRLRRAQQRGQVLDAE